MDKVDRDLPGTDPHSIWIAIVELFLKLKDCSIGLAVTGVWKLYVIAVRRFIQCGSVAHQ